MVQFLSSRRETQQKAVEQSLFRPVFRRRKSLICLKDKAFIFY